MIVDLFQISEPEQDIDVEIAPGEIDLQEDAARIETPLRVISKLRKGIAQTDVEGEIKGEIEIDCTRCLTPVKTPLQVPFKVAYVTAENSTQETEARLRGEDLDFSVFNGEQIDLTDLAREQILLNLPTQLFCKENCKGLCAKCGANKNTVNCNCEENETDPRWSALKNLK